MLPIRIRQALQEYRTGKIDDEEMERVLANLPFEEMGFAKVDHHRPLRQSSPEVIFGQGKSSRQLLEIARSILANSANLLVTRVQPEIAEALKGEFDGVDHNEAARTVTIIGDPPPKKPSPVGIVSAGTSDIPVAEEAAVTARFLGSPVQVSHDAGVAGIHRILSQREKLGNCRVVIVVAGMEGALPSVVGGLLNRPVIAVPTSVGYGASFGGLAALLGMLNSCASNVAVVNIDNGFGAGYVANLINQPVSSRNDPG